MRTLHRIAQQAPQLAGERPRGDRLAQEDRHRIGHAFNQIPADDNGGQIRLQATDARDEPLAAHAGHLRIGDDGVQGLEMFPRGLQSRGSIFAGNYVITGRLQHFGEQQTDGSIILNDQNRRGVSLGIRLFLSRAQGEILSAESTVPEMANLAEGCEGGVYSREA